MFKTLIDFFISYARAVSPGKMALQLIMLMIVSSWLGLVALVSLNFPTIMDLAQRYRDQQNVILQETLEASVQVNQFISEQRVIHDVDRLYVSRFHNGRVDVNGIHFIYFSRVSEATRGGVSQEIDRAQSLPLSIFPKMLEPISEGECYYTNRIDSTVENSRFLQDMGINSMLVCPIYTADGKLIGIVGAEGVLNPISNDQVEDLEQSLTTMAGVLGSLLTLMR